MLRFIAQHNGNVNKDQVVDYMNSSLMPAEDRSSKTKTLKLIGEAERDLEIKVNRGRKRGQSHWLWINHGGLNELLQHAQQSGFHPSDVQLIQYRDITFERQEEIREFITENPGISENRIVEYMNKESMIRSSKMTTIKDLNELKKGNIIRVELAQRRGQANRLFTNTLFYRIYQQLPQIETCVDEMGMQKESKSQSSYEILQTILSSLLCKAETLQHPIYARILYNKINKLMQKLILRRYGARNINQFLTSACPEQKYDNLKKIISNFNSNLS